MTIKKFSNEVQKLIKKAKKNKTCLRFDEVALILDKSPTVSQVKTLIKLINSNKSCLYTSSQYTEIQNIVDAQQEEDLKREEYIQAISEKYNISKETELLEWSRSDSPVRMYLREMGRVPLLEKEDEVKLAKQIELGQDIILDAISSVPYLIDFIEENVSDSLSSNELNSGVVSKGIITGQLVKNLLESKLSAGNYSLVWNGKNDQGRSIGSGIYFYKLSNSGKTVAVKKMLMLK